ncbi:unnamed protein product [Oikopleura dioica]|uniref:Uncharacterized protein n=1 Tax=Oikopleura dioica TaxID=34765 RepID=E4WXY2_OIKDI|nr:unnamed protein product [Oikopleura dioica]
MEEYMDDLSPKFERSKGPRKRKVQRGPWESPGISLRPDVPKIDYNRRPPPLELCNEDMPPILREIFLKSKKSDYDEEEDDPNSKDLFAAKEESPVVAASSSGAPIFKESDSNSDLESPGPSKTSTQRGMKKRQSLNSNLDTLSTMSSVVYPDVDASKLGYSSTTSFGTPTRGHSTVLMPKPVLGIPKFNESEEQEYVSSDEEAPPADQIFQQTSINRLSRQPHRERTIYTPPSTLCVTTDYETTGSIKDEETRVASPETSQRASQKSSQFDQTWDDEDGFEEALENIDGINTSAVSVQTDITDGKVTQKDTQDDEWEDDGLDDYFISVCQDMDKTKAAKNTTPSTTSTSTKSSFERLQELRAVEKRKRSDPDLDSRKRTKSESTAAKPQQTGTRKIQKTLKITKQTAKPISKPEQN